MSSIKVGSGIGLLLMLHWTCCSTAALNSTIQLQLTNYAPCTSINLYVVPLKIQCKATGWNWPTSNDFLLAFQRNSPNSNIASLIFEGSEFNHMMTESELNTILQLVGQGSADTLKEIYLSDLNMQHLPESINMFSTLDKLTVRNYKEILHLPSGFISIPSLTTLTTLNLMKNRIYTIDPNAFQGDFSRVKIDLGSNMLTSVDQQVFLPLLQSMFNNRGRISISPSNIQCGCGLTWLVRDRPELIPYLIDTQCYDSERGLKVNVQDWNWRDSNCPNKSNAMKAISYTATVTLLLFSSMITKLLCW